MIEQINPNLRAAVVIPFDYIPKIRAIVEQSKFCSTFFQNIFWQKTNLSD